MENEEVFWAPLFRSSPRPIHQGWEALPVWRHVLYLPVVDVCLYSGQHPRRFRFDREWNSVTGLNVQVPHIRPPGVSQRAKCHFCRPDSRGVDFEGTSSLWRFCVCCVHFVHRLRTAPPARNPEESAFAFGRDPLSKLRPALRSNSAARSPGLVGAVFLG